MIEAPRDRADTQTLLAAREQFVPRGVSTPNHVFVERAQGARVWDESGREFIDFAGGIGTMNVGHSHPAVIAAVQEQAAKFTHTCFHIAMYEPYVRLAERLAEIAPIAGPTKAMLVNSGAEAVENAIKIARVASGRPGVIAFSCGFHGRTLLGMSLTGKESPYKAEFGQMAPDVYRAPYPYAYRAPAGVDPARVGEYSLSVLEDMFHTHVSAHKVAAIILEPVAGEAGFIVPPRGFLRDLRALCDRHGILLIADEVQTGYGRTGRMFAVEHEQVQPDLMVVAKSMAAGMPMAAVIGRGELMDAPSPGGLGGTYGGNPVSCAAALAVLEIFEQEHLVERGARLGEKIRARLEALARRVPLIGEVRGLGAMLAIELVRDRATREPAARETSLVHERCQDNGLLLARAGLHGNVIRLLPPLTITDEDLEAGFAILEGALTAGFPA